MEVDDRISEAIRAGARAGLYRKAARLNPRHELTWGALARPHTAKVTELLEEVCDRLGAEAPGRSSHVEEG